MGTVEVGDRKWPTHQIAAAIFVERRSWSRAGEPATRTSMTGGEPRPEDRGVVNLTQEGSSRWLQIAPVSPLLRSHVRQRIPHEVHAAALPCGAQHLGGRWNDRQIVSKAWIETSTASKIAATDGQSYGYLWWRGWSQLNGRKIRWIGALGRGGQSIRIVPDLDLVVAVTAGYYQDYSPQAFRSPPLDHQRQHTPGDRNRCLSWPAGSASALHSPPPRPQRFAQVGLPTQ
jgi:CubicO group peptidase (beta-lactamase class C family)